MSRRSSTIVSRVTFVLAASASIVACAAGIDEPSRGAEGVPVVDCPASIASWAADTSVTRGELAMYHGDVYRCVQSHTTLSVWPPDIVPALWEKVACSGSTPPETHDAGPPSGGDKDTGVKPPPGDPDTGTKPPPPPPPPSDAGPPDPGPSGGTEYAPYFYSWGWGNSAYAFSGLADLKSKSGLSAVTIAFVLSNGGCTVTRDIQDHKSDVDAFRAAGGHLKASFGGADGTYLENGCSDDASMAKAIEAFVDETGITDLDFDVEQGGAMNSEVNARRSKALKRVQDTKGIKVAFTLPAFPRDKWATPGGMTAAALDVVKSAVSAGVKISHVNLMTMDYGGYYSTGYKMGDLAVSAVTDAAIQLKSVIPSLTDAQAFAMLAATPMIGQNDVGSEVFSLEDARILIAFAKEKHLGLVSFWAINRDQPGSDLGTSSKAESAKWQFHEIFRTVL